MVTAKGDHFKYALQYAKSGIDVWMEIENKGKFLLNHRLKFFKEKVDFKIGNFKIKAFPLEHDVKTNGFLIEEESMGRMVFITDTHFCKYKFEGVHHFCIEANYCETLVFERMMKGELDGFLRNRIQQSHMSFSTTKEFLKANDLSNVRTITLLHLSSGHADASRFKRETEELTGKSTFIADTGTEIDLSLNPF